MVVGKELMRNKQGRHRSLQQMGKSVNGSRKILMTSVMSLFLLQLTD